MIEFKDYNKQEFMNLLHIKKDTFHKVMNEICKKYDMKPEQFKVYGKKAGKRDSLTKDENEYLFKKEWVDIAYILFKIYMDNPFYRQNSNNVTDIIEKGTGIKEMKELFERILDYNKNIICNIEESMFHENREKIQLNISYMFMLLENQQIESLYQAIDLLINVLVSSSINNRTSLYAKLNDTLNELIILLCREEIESSIQSERHFNTEKNVVSSYNDFKNIKIDDFKNSFFEPESIDYHIAEILKIEINTDYTSNKQKIRYKDFEKILEKNNEKDFNEMLFEMNYSIDYIDFYQVFNSAYEQIQIRIDDIKELLEYKLIEDLQDLFILLKVPFEELFIIYHTTIDIVKKITLANETICHYINDLSKEDTIAFCEYTFNYFCEISLKQKSDNAEMFSEVVTKLNKIKNDSLTFDEGIDIDNIMLLADILSKISDNSLKIKPFMKNILYLGILTLEKVSKEKYIMDSKVISSNIKEIIEILLKIQKDLYYENYIILETVRKIKAKMSLESVKKQILTNDNIFEHIDLLISRKDSEQDKEMLKKVKLRLEQIMKNKGSNETISKALMFDILSKTMDKR